MSKAMLEATVKTAMGMAAEAQMRLDAINKFGNDEYEPGTVLCFSKTFTPGGTVYDYLALKAPNGQWYVTGMTCAKARNWEELIAWQLDKGTLQGAWIVIKWESIL